MVWTRTFSCLALTCLKLQLSRSEAAECGPRLVTGFICIMSRLSEVDTTLFSPVHRVLQVYRTVTKHCNYCRTMATTHENMLKHLKLALERLEELSNREIVAIEDEVLRLLFDILDKFSALLLEITKPGSRKHEGTRSPMRDSKFDDAQYPIHRG